MLIESLRIPTVEQISPTDDPLIEGFHRRPPSSDSPFAMREYRKGFIAGIREDFEGLTFNPYDVPWDQDSYDAFLTGLAGAKEPRIGAEFRFHEQRSHIENSYILGLSLMQYYSGVRLFDLNVSGFPEQLRLYPRNLKHYQRKAYGTE